MSGRRFDPDAPHGTVESAWDSRQLDVEGALEEALGQWQHLAYEEGEAIRARNWARLADCQNAIETLQAQVTRCLSQARAQWPEVGTSRADRERQHRARASQLLEIERQNGALLHEAHLAARARLERLRLAGRTLRMLRTSYCPARPPAWSSFS